MRKFGMNFFIIAAATAIFTLSSGITANPSSDKLLRYWEDNHLAPQEYVIEKFKDYNWVFLGEFHRIKHDVDLVAALIPLLHERTDVRYLATEFLFHEASARANELVTASDFNRAEMIDFFRNQFPSWSYEEYFNIFKAIWQSNKKFAAERGPFQIVGLNPGTRWEVIHYGKDPDAVKQEKDKQTNYDVLMAKWLEKDLLKQGKKALIATGIAHSTAKYKEYWVGQKGKQLVRMGNLVYKNPYKSKMFFIALHAPFYDSAANKDIYPFDGALDRLMKRFQQDIGFDVVGTPFESLSHQTRSPYSITAYSFGELFDGYIIFRTPIKQYRGISCIPDWLKTEQDFEHYWKNLSNKEASVEFSKIPFDEFKKTFCSGNPSYGEGFARRFRRLPDIK
jgi:uncharacterized iron-regulated protein